jgi:hypothetical protein
VTSGPAHQPRSITRRAAALLSPARP